MSLTRENIWQKGAREKMTLTVLGSNIVKFLWLCETAEKRSETPDSASCRNQNK